jgi:hypothetical protein
MLVIDIDEKDDGRALVTLELTATEVSTLLEDSITRALESYVNMKQIEAGKPPIA